LAADGDGHDDIVMSNGIAFWGMRRGNVEIVDNPFFN
jgi:hypothetical protein